MTKFTKFLITTAIAAVVLPSAAMAGAISGSSDGSFSNLTSCDSSGNDRDCQIIDTSNGSNTEVQWDRDVRFSDDPSTLEAVDIDTSSFTTAQTGVHIAELQWHNTAIDSNDGDLNTLGVSYSLVFSFTVANPGGGTTGNQTLNFGLTINNVTNSTGDSIGAFALSDISGLSYSLPGWTVNGFQYLVTDVSGSGTPYLGTCPSVSGSNNWCNPENNISDLFITANFTPTTTTGVPEPMTLSLFGAGLAGAAAMRLRRRKKA